MRFYKIQEKYLKKFIEAKHLPANPRQLKRFMNHYIVMREILSIEGNLEKYDKGDSDEDKSIRFLIFSLNYPTLKDKIRLGCHSVDDIVEKKTSCIELNDKLLTNSEISEIKNLISKGGNKITNELIRGDFYSI